MEKGAQEYLDIMSYVSTAKMPGSNAYTAIKKAIIGTPDYIFAGKCWVVTFDLQKHITVCTKLDGTGIFQDRVEALIALFTKTKNLITNEYKYLNSAMG